MKKLLWAVLGILGLGAIVYFLGPKQRFDSVTSAIPNLDVSIDGLDSYIADKEAAIADIKPDNEARIIWKDSTHQKTPYSVVYLHGFSASQEEGDPVHTDFAQRYGCNLFLPRLYDHGRADSNSFQGLTPEKLMASAREAIAIGKLLGDKVIVMSCSTGSTLSAYLAAENPVDIHSQIMYSPNIDIYDPLAQMLTMPWGYQLARWSFKGDYNRIEYPPLAQKYWNEIYHIDGTIAVKALINQTMKEEVFSKIEQPLYLGYYYENEEKQDKVVSVARMHDFYKQVSTADEMKEMESFPAAGRHVIASHVMSPAVDEVRKETYAWAEKVLGLTPVNP